MSAPEQRGGTPNLNPANGLTLVRFLLVPVVAWTLAAGAYGWTLALFAAAGATDGLDGLVAKRFGFQTRLGAVLDPLADKALVVTAALLLTARGLVPPWLTAAIVGRDAVILLGAVAFRLVTGSVTVAPTLLSKVNTAVQLGTLVLVLAFGVGMPIPPDLLRASFFLTLVTTVASGLHYVAGWSRRALSGH